MPELFGIELQGDTFSPVLKKACSKCKQILPYGLFLAAKNAHTILKLDCYCIDCRHAWSRAHYQRNREKALKRRHENYLANPGQHRAGHRRRTYGISTDAYEALLKSQGGLCGICKDELTESIRPCIDHNHTTGLVRGILCGSCNKALGFLKDSPERARLAIAYLEEDIMRTKAHLS